MYLLILKEFFHVPEQFLSYKYKTDFFFMDIINIKLSDTQIALILEMLKPYTELSMSLSNQYKQQLLQKSMPVRAKKEENQNPEENNANN